MKLSAMLTSIGMNDNSSWTEKQRSEKVRFLESYNLRHPEAEAFQRLRSAVLQLEFEWSYREPQKFSHKTRVNRALTEVKSSLESLRIIMAGELAD